MPLYHTEDQAMLQESAAAFMKAEAPVAHLRKVRDGDCRDGFSRDLWKQFAEMGFTGMLIPEEDGGLGMGHVEAGIVMEAIGRNLSPSPFLTTSVVGVEALKAADSAVRQRWLPGIAGGEAVLGIAIEEGAKHNPAGIAMQAQRSGNGFRLTGRKQFVIQGASADLLIVAARTAGGRGETDGITLFAVEKGASGLTAEGVRLVDSSIGAHVTFDGVEVDADAVIGEVDQGWAVLGRMLRAGRTGAAAEMVGVGAGAMGMTVDYLKQRKQFGRLIGEFQALQHRAAHLYAEMEMARAAVLKAQQLLDEGSEQADLMVSVAKAKAGQAAGLAVREGVQMHGGIGMTDEYDVGLYMKRDRALQEYMGDVNYHTDQVARAHEY